MAVVWRWILSCVLLFAAAPGLRAAASAEKAAFDAASRMFNDSFWDRAESLFAQFAQTYPNSPRLPEAFLYQAEARFQQTNYSGALELLAAHQAEAGKLADLYVFWQAETLFQKGDLPAAAAAFARLIREFPASSNRLQAVVREATANARLGEWARVVGALQAADSPFQLAAATNAAAELVVRGRLLLAEAHLAQTNVDAADAALRPLAAGSLQPGFDWQRQFIQCRILLARGRLAEAWDASTNLPPLAAAAGKREAQAETVAFQAGLLERLGREEEAVAAYEKNLADAVPPERQRQALLKITELYLRQNRLDAAAQVLERFLARYPAAPSADLALLTLGELRLRQHESGLCTNVVSSVVTNLPAATNCLQQALASLRSFVSRFPQSPWRGRADLYLGWCFWREGNIPSSQAAFQSAVGRLAPSPDLAMAYFKLADAQYRLTNFNAAISNYSAVLLRFEAFPEVKTNLFEPALYHIVRAALEAGNVEAATGALEKILAWYPKGFYTDRAVLLTGQVVGNRNPAAARKMFQDYLRLMPETPRRPQLELAIAATYEQENLWDAAIQEYDAWVSAHTNHEALARAEYARAWANFQAGHDTNALTEFTNFIAGFPTHEFAPRAQLWVGDYYYRQADFQKAEENYQWCYQNTNWPVSKLTYEARMMAGRAAFARSAWKDAKDYFGWLASNTNCPTELRARAFFAFGDTLVSEASTNKLSDYKEALNAYDRVAYLCPSNALAIQAVGAKANCFLQAQDYEGATNAFLQVVNSSLADAAGRASAKVGLGLTLEKLAQLPGATNETALLTLARDQYLDVFENNNFLREGEKADPFWTMKAGTEAVRLCEALKQPGQARRLCEELRRMFPWLRLDDKIKALAAQEELARDTR